MHANTPSKSIRLFLGADHGGFSAKEQLKEWLDTQSLSYTDVGAHSFNPEDDYPQIAFLVGEAVSDSIDQEEKSLGILFCRSGGGMSIAANKVRGIRAVPVASTKEAIHAREHNDAQIISVSADWLTNQEIQDIIEAFVGASASNDTRHVRRRAQIERYEESN